MATRQYIGARYVPKFSDPVEWNIGLRYEPLTIVTHLGNSYTSKKPVPAGVDITDNEYWVNTGNYNAQVEEYRKLADQTASYTFYVATTGDDANTGLSAVTPVKTISRAIALAMQKASYATIVIEVANGVYNENVVISSVNKPKKFTINGNGATMNDPSNGDGICLGIVNSFGVTINNMNFTNGRRGIQAAESNITINNCKFTNCTAGFNALDHTLYWLDGCAFSDCDFGISEYFGCVRSVTTLNTITRCKYGLMAKELCTGHFNNVVITDCEFGVYFVRNSTGNIEGTTIHRSTKYAVVGVEGSYLGGLYNIDLGFKTENVNAGTYRFDSTSYGAYDEGGSRVNLYPVAYNILYCNSDIIENPNQSIGYIEKGTLSAPQSRYKILVEGRSAGGESTLDIRIGSSPNTFVIPAGVNDFKIEFDIINVGNGRQLVTYSLTTNNSYDRNSGYRTLENNKYRFDITLAKISGEGTVYIDNVVTSTTCFASA